MKHVFFCAALVLSPLLAGGCLLTSDFDGLSSGGGSASSSTSGGDGDCCLGQLCGADGACLPVELAAQGSPSSIALSDTAIYWTDTTLDEIRTLPKVLSAGYVAEVFAAGETNAENAYVRDGFLYWSRHLDGDDTFAVMRRPLDASADPTSVVSGAGHVTGLAVDGTHAYFSVEHVAASTAGLYRVTRAGGAAETLVAPGPYGLRSVALDQAAPDGDTVYWARASSAPEGAIVSIHKDKVAAEQPAVRVAAQSRPWSLVVDDGALYWTNSASDGADGYAVMTAASDGSGLSTVDDSLSSPWALAKHGTTLAWTALGAGSNVGQVAMRVLPDGPVRVLAANEAWPGSVATDGRAVVWANEYDGRVRMMGTCACTP